MTTALEYSRKKTRARERSKVLTIAGQDIGALPAVKNPRRRERADNDFEFFCRTYFPSTFYLEFSDDHRKVIKTFQVVVTEGGMFAIAMPRGSGKTTLCQVAALWAILTGRARFVFLIGATAKKAVEAIETLKTHLSTNELLAEDYPEACYPIHRLEGESRRCAGQRYYGRQTHIGWTADEIIFPTIPGSRCSGAIVRTAGLLGNIRGANYLCPDGSVLRPDLVIIDDPQDDESARSVSQTHQREKLINGAVLGLAGPGKRIAAIMPCTVICPDDLADKVLKLPEWQGQRTKMVYAFPADEKLWDEYARIRNDKPESGGGKAASTRFYAEHRAQMDAGSIVAWPARFEPDELSAIQCAMNLKIRNEAAFFAEYQNEPLPELAIDNGLLSAEEIAAKLNGTGFGYVPPEATTLTSFIDVQKEILYWMICAFQEDDFTGSIVAYGSYPDQKRNYFTLRDTKVTLSRIHKGMGLEARIFAGLKVLTAQLDEKEWPHEDGGGLRIERGFIDSAWGETSDLIKKFCREQGHGVWMPSRGKFIGASGIQFGEYKRRQGERIGDHWNIPKPEPGQPRRIIIDTNHWKSFIQNRLATAIGDPGCLSLPVPPRGRDHQALAEHLTAEYRVPTTAKNTGRTVDEWKLQPGRDNHWLDCLVGCAVAASERGCKLPGMESRRAGGKRRLRSLSEMQGA